MSQRREVRARVSPNHPQIEPRFLTRSCGSATRGHRLPGAARKLGETVPSGVSGDGHVAFVPGDSTDSKPSVASDEREASWEVGTVSTLWFLTQIPLLEEQNRGP